MDTVACGLNILQGSLDGRTSDIQRDTKERRDLLGGNFFALGLATRVGEFLAEGYTVLDTESKAGHTSLVTSL